MTLAKNRPLVCALLLLGFLLATNRWVSWGEGLERLFLVDVKEGYLWIAEAAPGFPAQAVADHKAQRLALPWAVGATAKATGASIPAVFFAAVAMLHLLLLAAFWRLLQGLPERRKLVAFALFALQPYALRYYWMGPGMAEDCLFEVGMLGALLGALHGNPLFLLGGLVLSALGRQTALLLVPGLLVLAWRAPTWRDRRLFASVITVAVPVAVGVAIKAVAAKFSDGQGMAVHVYGIVPWLLGGGTPLELAIHALRCFLPLAAPLGMLAWARPKSWNHETWALLLAAAAVVAQPFLAGPEITGQNAGRLATLALLPLVLAWARAEPRVEWPARGLAIALIALAAASFHHVYTSVGPGAVSGSVALQVCAAVMLFGAARAARNQPASPATT